MFLANPVILVIGNSNRKTHFFGGGLKTKAVLPTQSGTILPDHAAAKFLAARTQEHQNKDAVYGENAK